jgi:hypothetical protein
MAGLFVVHQEGAALSKLFNDLLLLDECSDTEEWVPSSALGRAAASR